MKKNILALFSITVFLLFVSCNDNSQTNLVSEQNSSQNVFENIMGRKSVRDFQNKPVEKEKVDTLLKAAMAAPSGMDRRPWEFIVVNDRGMLDRLSEGLENAKMLSRAPMAIIVCGNTERSSYWYLDCSAASQNILLMAESLGLGAVWTAAYPYEDRIAAINSVISLPENILPLNVIPIGYPQGENVAKMKHNENKVHYNKW